MKKINAFCLIMVGVQFLVSVLAAILDLTDVTWISCLSYGIMLLTVFLYLAAGRFRNVPDLHFHKISLMTVVQVVILAFVSEPFCALFAYLSSLFSKVSLDDTVDTALQNGLGPALLILAILPAFTEELLYRGVIQGGYRRKDSSFRPILYASLFFALLHMNFAQIPYAFLYALLMGVVVELTGSIWSSMLIHLVINGTSVMSSFQMMQPGYAETARQAQEQVDNLSVGMTFAVLIPMAFVSLLLTILLLYFIAKRNGTMWKVRDWFLGTGEPVVVNEDGSVSRPKRQKYWDIFLIATVVLCLLVAVASEFI
ncbi:MAG: lysostaphin resistance A-like protein [Lachnospiraceae bacterium]